MKPILTLLLVLCVDRASVRLSHAAGAIAYLSGKGVQFTKSADGRTTRLMSGGKESLTPEEYARSRRRSKI